MRFSGVGAKADNKGTYRKPAILHDRYFASNGCKRKAKAMKVALLANRTWRELRVVARTHGFRFENRWTHEEAQTALRRTLLDEAGLKKILRRLNAEEQEALLALKTHEGRMVRYTFTRLYGKIRPYRPWRDDALPHPWRRPISTAEKLWFLGLIEVQVHQAVLLPEAVSALLPEVPHPQTTLWAGDEPNLDAVALVRDVALLLGMLLNTPMRLLHGRWLSPSALKAINRCLSQPEALTGVRSEFQTYRLRFLHYLAQTAGLVSVQNRRLLPTPEAWSWLNLPYQEAHAHLLAAVQADLHARSPLWEQFKLPQVGAAVWEALLALPSGVYTVGSVAETFQLQLLDGDASLHIRAALLGPLRWLGMGALDLAQMMLQLPKFGAIGRAEIKTYPDSIGVILPSAPPLRPLVELLAWARVDEAGLRLDAPSIALALESGLSLAQMLNTLTALTGAVVPDHVKNKLKMWERAARQVQIRQVVVLEVAHEREMQAIRADWRLRPFLGQQLSPRHVVVRDEYTLRQRLIRRGYRVPPLVDKAADLLPRTNSDDPAYLWVALRVCQALTGLIPAPILFPGAAAQSLEPLLSNRLTALREIADHYVGRVQEALRPRADDLEERPQQQAAAHIQRVVEQAQQQGRALMIRYYSPYSDDITERVIEPQTIYARNGATYVEAWCQRESAARTFRVDRILEAAETLPIRALA